MFKLTVFLIIMIKLHFFVFLINLIKLHCKVQFDYNYKKHSGFKRNTVGLMSRLVKVFMVHDCGQYLNWPE